MRVIDLEGMSEELGEIAENPGAYYEALKLGTRPDRYFNPSSVVPQLMEAKAALDHAAKLVKAIPTPDKK